MRLVIPRIFARYRRNLETGLRSFQYKRQLWNRRWLLLSFHPLSDSRFHSPLKPTRSKIFAPFGDNLLLRSPASIGWYCRFQSPIHLKIQRNFCISIYAYHAVKNFRKFPKSRIPLIERVVSTSIDLPATLIERRRRFPSVFLNFSLIHGNNKVRVMKRGLCRFLDKDWLVRDETSIPLSRSLPDNSSCIQD